METIIRLKTSELNMNLIKWLKLYLTGDTEIELKIPAIIHKDSVKKETQQECNARIEKAIEDIENGKNLVLFSAEQFDIYMSRMLK
ncbi:MAG: hypothetical protein KJ607_08155 [Bacteroidetes bacterium]|nr:hypothetical protein [Bacteroidota bacterium]